LIATNNIGCLDSIVKIIQVKDQVKADFTYSTACINVPVTFTDNSIVPAPNNMNTRNWNFGTSTATGLSVTRTYTNAGNYNVVLTVNGFNGCSNSITKPITVYLPPDADFNSSIACVNDSFDITDASLAINGSIVSWLWKHNNNSFSNQNTASTSFSSSGNKAVTLIVSNSFGCIDSITKNVYVNPLPDATFSLNPATYIYTGLPISITPAFSGYANYFWSLSDGTNYNDPALTLQFGSSGSFQLQLDVTDNLGCKNSSVKNFSVAFRKTDLGMIAARTALDAEGFVSVEADLINYGSTPVQTFEISYEITGGGIIKESWNGNLPPGAVSLFSFNAKTFLNVVEREKALSCVIIKSVNGGADENPDNDKICAAMNNGAEMIGDLFPNPSENDVQLPVVLLDDQKINISVYDQLGRIIFEGLSFDGVKGLNFITIPFAKMEAGSYSVRISTTGNNYIRKLVKYSEK
ncbi:MAG: PKD domain-containing protein, partial [Sediminibacterium sp.]